MKIFYFIYQVVLHHSDDVTNKKVKRCLRKSEFFEQVFTLSQILLPIKNAIKILEGDKATLSDVFIQLVRLAYKIKHIKIKNMAGFKNHMINSFNSRWEEFDIDSYLLAYFLHPAYRSMFIFNTKFLCNIR